MNAVNRKTARTRISRGWDPERARTEPVRPWAAHGHAPDGAASPEYRAWTGMVTRCTNDRRACWKNYGGRGIGVCDRWRSFPPFLEDMGPKPSPRHSLDRINNDGNYEPGNCRWATQRQQVRNSRHVRLYTWNGETKTLTEWSVGAPVLYRTFVHRVVTLGWDIGRARSAPKNTRTNRVLELNGERLCLKEWATRLGMDSHSLSARIDAGWPLEKALTHPPRRWPTECDAVGHNTRTCPRLEGR